MKEIKNCPFCGSRAEIYIVNKDDDEKRTMYNVSCLATDSSYHGADGVIDDWCPMECESPECPTEEQAIEIWNEREK